MSAALILAPLPIVAIAGDDPTTVGHLLTSDPREVWAPAGAASIQFTADLGAAVAIDTVFLGYSILKQASAVVVKVDGVQVGASAFALPRRAGRYAHALILLNQGVIGQHVQVIITVAAGDRPQSLGVLMIGQRFQPQWNHEWGAGRVPVDTGTRTRLQGGGYGLDAGIVKSGWQWTFGDLSDGELDQVFDIVMDRGETGPVLVVENPDQTAGLAERIHYGTFDRIEAFERQDVQLTRWSLRIEDWL